MRASDFIIETPELKKEIISLVNDTESEDVLNKVQSALRSTELTNKFKSAIKNANLKQKWQLKLTRAIIHLPGKIEDKISFIENINTGFIDINLLLSGDYVTYSDIVEGDFARVVFDYVAHKKDYGVGQVEFALVIMSPNIAHIGSSGSKGGDVVINGKGVEIKAKDSRGGRWIDTRKAKMKLDQVQKKLQALIPKDSDYIVPERIGAKQWIDDIRPQLKLSNNLQKGAEILAKASIRFTDSTPLSAALVGGDRASMEDAALMVGFDNYKAYSKFDYMIIADVNAQAMQTFSSFDEIRGNVKHNTIYFLAPAGEMMPQVELIIKETDSFSKPSTEKTVDEPKDTENVIKDLISDK